MKKLSVTILAIVGLALQASALSFNFSFDGDTGLGSVPGTVTGTIFGLVDNAPGQAATSILITSFPAGLGGTLSHPDLLDFSSQVANNFNVSGGQIIGGGFAAQDSGDTVILGPVAAYYGFNNVLTLDNGNTIVGNFDGSAGIVFTPVSSSVPDAGSSAILLGSACLGLWSLRRYQATA